MNELLTELKELNRSKNEIEEKLKKVKEELESAYLTEEGYKDDTITINYTKPSRSLSIDLAALEKKEPDLYSDLLNDYQKVTERKGSYRYSFK